MTIQQRLWLALPPVGLCLADAALTLWSQSPDYWRGDYAQVLEFNPLGHVLLASHPLAFAGGIAVYVVLVLALLLGLTRRWAVLLAFALSVGHAIGAAGWLAREGFAGFLIAVGLIVAAERLVGLSWRKSGWELARP